ncbi:hypothetical protein [Cellulophaga sp. BC115SP]|uniref:hypothetical protein n=1 Tax=Cellulophaga sp. BC115SP TaxID=2683263 RepID=UPI00141203B5|nr:hypothetical protein [Cellulophaga sp. BC115SP]NBB32019.1 hypothetical protein [Cellulophaga sp. BC115SP]
MAIDIKNVRIGMSVKATSPKYGYVKLYDTADWDEDNPSKIDFGGVIGKMNNGLQLGIIQDVYEDSKLALVQLYKPILYMLKYRTNAIVPLSDLTTISTPTVVSGTKNYYCTGDSVRIRTGASLTSAIKSAVNKGNLIGQSDGKSVNGFLKFNLATGGVGYVAEQYCSTVKPVTSQPVKKTVTKTDTSTGKTKDVVVTQVDTGEGWTVKEVIIKGAIGAVAGFLAIKLIGKLFKLQGD